MAFVPLRQLDGELDRLSGYIVCRRLAKNQAFQQRIARQPSKYPPAKLGALICEPLKQELSAAVFLPPWILV
jgi:hypothetical protein